MRRALRLAAKAWGRTSPNPLVGAIVSQAGKTVGRGWHQEAGGPHAEIHALQEAGDSACGASLFVTLEPCSTAGRTPPCVDAVVAAGVTRVVIGCLDPNPDHAGRAVDLLERAGIEVRVGVEAAACRQLNEAFNCWIRYRRPYVLLKLAVTLDGRIATAAGDSRWISGESSRAEVQRLRQWADAVLVGGETVRCDDPQLTVRQPPDWPRQPLRLVASRSSQLGNARLLNDGGAETRVVSCATRSDWQELLQSLGAEEITALLVEGGGELAGELLNHGLVDKVAFFVAPKILGGTNSRPAVGGPDPASLAAARELADPVCRQIGNDILITGYLSDVHRYS